MSRPLRFSLLGLAFGAALSLAVHAESARYFVIGDTGDCDVPGAALVGKAIARVARPDRSTLIELGDLAYPTATRERLYACHEPHFGGFARRLAVPGNHDWADRDGAGFFDLFPSPVPRIEPLSGPWQLLLLNSNLSDSAWQNQLAWLDRTLSGRPDNCLIAVWHHPRWSSGKHGDNPKMQALWSRLQGKASLTMHGHEHHFEALPQLDAQGHPSANGLPSLIAGNSGAKLYPPGAGPQRSHRAIYGQLGFLRLELEDAAYRWQAINIDGKVLDQGEGRCHPAP